MAGNFRLNHAGAAAVLKREDTAAAVHTVAEKIANSARTGNPAADVVVDDYETDRAASSVTIRRADMLRHEKAEALIRAAASNGHEVHTKGAT